MSLQSLAKIEINGSANSDFDHGAFDPKTRRVFVAQRVARMGSTSTIEMASSTSLATAAR